MEKSERIKILRILNGFTQDALASKAGIAQVSLVAWERGSYSPTSSAVEALAPFLGCLPSYIMFGNPPISGSAWIPAPPARPHHLKKMQTDTYALFPGFVAENGYDYVISGILADGGRFFLFLRKNRIECLLLADSKLVDSIFECVKYIFEADRIVDISIMDCHTLNNFDSESINVIILEWLRTKHGTFTIDLVEEQLSFDIGKIHTSLNNKRFKEVYDPDGNILDDLFKYFFEVIKEYEITSEALAEISRFFVEKYHMIHSHPTNKVKNKISSEVKSKIESCGCDKRKETYHGLVEQIINDVSDLAKQAYNEFYRGKTRVTKEALQSLVVIDSKLRTLVFVSSGSLYDHVLYLQKILMHPPETENIEGTPLLEIVGALFEISNLSWFATIDHLADGTEDTFIW